MRAVTFILLAASARVLLAPALAADATAPAYWGSPSVNGGACCATLGDVRVNIDRIDQAILTLMAERQAYVAEAGRFKRDPARVEAIIVKTRALAAKDGLAEDVAERTFRAMIAAFEDYERKEWLARTKRSPRRARAARAAANARSPGFRPTKQRWCARRCAPA
jgi:isochorismate pyruvate lyase